MKQQLIAEEYRFLQSIIYRRQRKIDDAKLIIKTAENEIASAQRSADRIKRIICSKCNGVGGISVSYSQDECKAETCDKCEGSGIDNKHLEDLKR